MLFSPLGTPKWRWTRSCCNLCLLKQFMFLTFSGCLSKGTIQRKWKHFQEQNNPSNHKYTHTQSPFSPVQPPHHLLASLSLGPVSSGAWVKHKKHEHRGLFSDCLVKARQGEMHARAYMHDQANKQTQWIWERRWYGFRASPTEAEADAAFSRITG